MQRLGHVLLLLIAFPSHGLPSIDRDAIDEDAIFRQRLEDFRRDPRAALNAPIPKYELNGEVSMEKPPWLTGDAKEMRRLKNESRELICRQSRRSCTPKKRPSGSLWAETSSHEKDRVQSLLSGMESLDSLAAMENRRLTQGELDRVPWSDTYWPVVLGSLGWRYKEPSFPALDWWTNHAHVLAHPPPVVNPLHLSPSEKYDLLLGDANFTLTRANWQRGIDRLKNHPDVPGWVGLCHGWAAASYLEEEPVQSVTALSPTGETITFNPTEIKALLTSLWGDTEFAKISIGYKCGIENPPEDEMGRVKDPNCFTTNPGTWHVSIVNRVGVAKRSFLMDATYDREVWNQPIHSYKYKYFNPQTNELSPELFGTVLPIEQYAADPFRGYRSPRAKFIVGIAMEVVYVNETQPSPGAGRGRSSKKKVHYTYDLELDAAYRIIGGEWHSNKHPDFIWAPAADAHPLSIGEKSAGLSITWDGRSHIPASLLEAARVSSPAAQPVNGIVRGLLELSKNQH